MLPRPSCQPRTAIIARKIASAPKHWENEVPHKLLPQVVNVDLLHARRLRLQRNGKSCVLNTFVKRPLHRVLFAFAASVCVPQEGPHSLLLLAFLRAGSSSSASFTKSQPTKQTSANWLIADQTPTFLRAGSSSSPWPRSAVKVTTCSIWSRGIIR